MAIEINGLPQSQTQTAAERQQVDVGRGEPSAPEQETGNSTSADTVSLTDTASNLQKLENTISELPVVDSGRVESIRQSIASGDFEVNAESTAENMLRFEEELV